MAFSRKQWVDGYKDGTLITAEELNRIEGGIQEAIQAAAAALVPVGTVFLYSGWGVPTGWLECDGRELTRTAYPKLFEALRTVYGGNDGAGTFRLPDLRDRYPTGVSRSRPVGSYGGEASHRLTVSEMPSHSHNVQGTGGVWPTVGVWQSDVHAGTGWHIASGGTDGQIAQVTTAEVGAGQAHNNLPPYVALYYIIRAE